MKTLLTYFAGIAVLASGSAAPAQVAVEGPQRARAHVDRTSIRSEPAARSARTVKIRSNGPRGKLEAAFGGESYRPGERATLQVWGNPGRLTLQLFRTGPERVRTRGNDEMRGIAVAAPAVKVVGRRLGITVGDWASGMYFARIRAGAQVAYAPFVVRPRRLGESRVAVVMPTLTWQAYNWRDDDGNGTADTWYADRRQKTIRLARPYVNHGVPMRFRSYDLPFLHWLAWANRAVDYLAQQDLEAMTGATLRRKYDLIIFPGHHEYVTLHEFNEITRYRNLGGNLMFLSANNFFWRVQREGQTLRIIAMWRDIGRPEAALIGVQYVACCAPSLRGPYAVADVEAAPWLFRGMGLRNGSRFGTFGIEIDRISASSPRETVVLAQIDNGQGRLLVGQMTYYRTERGAKVFAAGAFALAGSATRSYGAKLLDNLWKHMTQG